MGRFYSGQSINLSCISSLRTQEPFLVVVQDILSARWILGLVFHLGFQTASIKCHSSRTLTAPEVMHMVVNVLKINLGIASWSNEGWVGLVFWSLALSSGLHLQVSLRSAVTCLSLCVVWPCPADGANLLRFSQSEARHSLTQSVRAAFPCPCPSAG